MILVAVVLPIAELCYLRVSLCLRGVRNEWQVSSRLCFIWHTVWTMFHFILRGAVWWHIGSLNRWSWVRMSSRANLQMALNVSIVCSCWDSNPGTNGLLDLHHTSIGRYLSVKNMHIATVETEASRREIIIHSTKWIGY